MEKPKQDKKRQDKTGQGETRQDPKTIQESRQGP